MTARRVSAPICPACWFKLTGKRADPPRVPVDDENRCELCSAPACHRAPESGVAGYIPYLFWVDE